MDKKQLKEKLSPLAWEVTQNAATEPAYSGEYDKFYELGNYYCICCDELLFESQTKFDSGCGWPAFFNVARQGVIGEREDLSYGMRRVEVICNNCKAHLGHVFKDGPPPTGLRYCINSVCLRFVPAEKKP